MLSKVASRTRLQSLTLKRYAFGGIQPAFPCFFDPADAVSDPKKVRILGNPTRFSLFFERKKGRRRAVRSLTKVNTRAIGRQRWGLQQAILRLQYIE